MKILVAFVVAALVVSCGGGGTGGSNPSNGTWDCVKRGSLR